jgi:hypothetical protein
MAKAIDEYGGKYSYIGKYIEPGYTGETMGDAPVDLNAAAAEFGLPPEIAREALKKAAVDYARTMTGRAKEPPRADWIEARGRGVTLPDFIAEKFEVELRDGTMTRAMLNRYDKLPGDFYGYPRHHEMPDWLKAIPTKARLNTLRLAERAEVGKPVRPVPRPRTDEQRLYDTAVKRRSRAGLTP